MDKHLAWSRELGWHKSPQHIEWEAQWRQRIERISDLWLSAHVPLKNSLARVDGELVSE